MEVVVAKNGGFCTGVRKAVQCAMEIDAKNTYIFGEIIHNHDVVSSIEKRGIITAQNLSDVPDGAKLIIRSHGVGKDVFAKCSERNIEVVDCTCAFVKRTQSIVEKKHEEGAQIVIIGEKTHPEVIGINGWCENSALIFSSETDDFSLLKDKKCAVVAQTTFSKEKFDKIIKIIRELSEKTVEIFETICYTTIGRQLEAEELSKNCDAMLVVGGLNSSNTEKLYEICKKNCKNVFRMKNAGDLDYKKLIGYKKVGVITGASTPDAQTQEVLLNMEKVAVAKETTMDDVIADIDNQHRFKRGQLITATVSRADASGIDVLLPNTKKEVRLEKDEIDMDPYDENAFKIGSQIELMVLSLTPALKLSQKRIKQLKEEEALLSGVQAGEEFSVVCSGTNKGGLVAELGTYSVFVPAREIRPGFVKDLEKYKGKTLRLKMLEIRNERRKEIIASQRVILEAERAAREAEREAKDKAFFESVHEGDVVEGKVERITSFGAFVSVKGFDCLAHISDLSWTGVKEVSDVLEIGKTYQFKVLKLDPETKKVSIGYKQLQAQPWDLAADKYVEGDVIHGKVVRIVPFGAFVEVEKGIDGLVHVSQISHEYLENPTTALTIGQEIDAKILKLDFEARKMNLSIKALLPRPEAPEAKEEGEVGTKKSGRKPKKEQADGEISEWKDNAEGGASIADLIKNA